MRLAQTQSALFSLVTQDRRSWLRPDALVAGGELDCRPSGCTSTPRCTGCGRAMRCGRIFHTRRSCWARSGPNGDAYVDAHHSDHPSLHRLGRVFRGVSCAGAGAPIWLTSPRSSGQDRKPSSLRTRRSLPRSRSPRSGPSGCLRRRCRCRSRCGCSSWHTTSMQCGRDGGEEEGAPAFAISLMWPARAAAATSTPAPSPQATARARAWRSTAG